MLFSNTFLSGHRWHSVLVLWPPLHFFFPFRALTAAAILFLENFPGLGVRSSPFRHFSSIYQWPLINYWLQGKVQMVQCDLRAPHTWAPSCPVILSFVLDGAVIQGPLARLSCSRMHVYICACSSISQGILPMVYLISKSTLLCNIQLDSHHP